jgi:hypothetical protein
MRQRSRSRVTLPALSAALAAGLWLAPGAEAERRTMVIDGQEPRPHVEVAAVGHRWRHDGPEAWHGHDHHRWGHRHWNRGHHGHHGPWEPPRWHRRWPHPGFWGPPVWIPGSWVWTGYGWRWVPGFWR